MQPADRTRPHVPVQSCGLDTLDNADGPASDAKPHLVTPWGYHHDVSEKRMSAVERRRRGTAYHEAGHAVMATILGFVFTRVSIEPVNGREGRVTYRTPRWVTKGNVLDPAVRQWFEANIMSQMAGFVAERQYRGRGDHIGATGDYASTYEMASLVSLSRKEAALYLDALFERTSVLMRQRIIRRSVSAVTRALLRAHSLTHQEVRKLVDDVFA